MTSRLRSSRSDTVQLENGWLLGKYGAAVGTTPLLARTDKDEDNTKQSELWGKDPTSTAFDTSYASQK